MTAWIDGEVVAVCPACGVDCSAWRGELDFGDARDPDELESAHLALALMAHRFEAHRVDVALGDLVRYWSPWRGRILGSEVYRVDAIRERDDHMAYARSCGADVAPMLGTSYTLTNPARKSDGCFPFVGDPRRPIVFELVAAAPPVEVDLMDLLEWEPAHA